MTVFGYSFQFNVENLKRATIHAAFVGAAAGITALGADLMKAHASDGAMVVGVISYVTNAVVSFLRKEADSTS